MVSRVHVWVLKAFVGGSLRSDCFNNNTKTLYAFFTLCEGCRGVFQRLHGICCHNALSEEVDVKMRFSSIKPDKDLENCKTMPLFSLNLFGFKNAIFH